MKALVYVAAFAPDANEPVAAFNDKYPSDLGAALQSRRGGLPVHRWRDFHDVFAADLPQSTTRVMAVTQKPVFRRLFGERCRFRRGSRFHSWFIVASQDHAINPELERFYAKRMHAKVTEVKSSHVVFISHPHFVADVIEQAGDADGRRSGG